MNHYYVNVLATTSARTKISLHLCISARDKSDIPRAVKRYVDDYNTDTLDVTLDAIDVQIVQEVSYVSHKEPSSAIVPHKRSYTFVYRTSNMNKANLAARVVNGDNAELAAARLLKLLQGESIAVITGKDLEIISCDIND